MFKFKNASYITSAIDKSGWINDNLLEIILLGKSNVGKSSFLNMLVNQNQLAKVSKIPGKTYMLNFFSINNNQFRIVDTPGYGFTKINNNYNINFVKMMKEYFKKRINLKFACLLVNLHLIPSKYDYLMYQYLKYFNILTILIGTKLDKVKKNNIYKQEKIIKEKLNFTDNNYFIKLSNKNKIYYDKCWLLFSKLLNFDN